MYIWYVYNKGEDAGKGMAMRCRKKQEEKKEGTGGKKGGERLELIRLSKESCSSARRFFKKFFAPFHARMCLTSTERSTTIVLARSSAHKIYPTMLQL